MKTVLVVDDDKTFIGLLKTIFEMEGYQAAVVSNRHEVLPTAHQVTPMLVLMDVHVGNEDTLSILREMRADEATKAVPVVMTSGMDLTTECLAAGASAFLLKPFRPSELLAVVTELIGERV